MRPLLVALGAGERCPSPCSFSHTVQVKPCVTSITVTALSLVGEVRGGRVSSKEGETKREAKGEGERERVGGVIHNNIKHAVLYSNDRVLAEMAVMDLLIEHL